MCGILCIVNNHFKKDELDKALALMNHRGPDFTDSTLINNVYLGHNRLSILDLSNSANQPFSINEYLMIYNGEVYNYKELIIRFNLKVKTNCDTEVVLLMYIKFGHKALEYFNGMFSIVIYNTIKNTIFVARDRLGIKPLYYSETSKGLIFSSEIEPILRLNNYDYDDFAIRQYKKLRITVKNHTVYKNIFHFPAGYYFDGRQKLKYWELNIEKKPPPSDEELAFLIEDAVHIRKRSDVPIGSYLSGGLDSTILSYLLKPDYTYTVGFNNENEFKWSELANNQCIKSNHIKTLIDENEFLKLAANMITKRKEPLSVPNEVLIFKMTKIVRNNNKVVLSGEGADELFWGYHRIFNKVNLLNLHDIKISEFDKYYCYGTHNDNEVIEYALEGLPGKSGIDKLGFFFQTTHLQGLLRRLDNATMLCGVEARVPFVDHRIVEALAGVPFEWKMGNSFKEPLKRLFRGKIPSEIINREKVGFPVPLKKIFDVHLESYDQWLNFNIRVLKQNG